MAHGCSCSEAVLDEVTLTQGDTAADLVHPMALLGAHKPMLLGARATSPSGRGGLKAGPAKASEPSKAHTEKVLECGTWSWPDWAVQSRIPDIQVFVVDDEAGVSCWVDAVPQCRVVDREGRDTFLSAQYCWEGEHFDEDFGPEQVRRRGSTLTVAQIL
eukprot:CAMPEP_0115240046 /NCGR_PEP_ID=MMETSP0270-20121206/37711_1 /TAXON_ID=71861 /ORGANISM="Scrippsiella trochoidea, Strain CCMP3099" /LENGTH=158 /DNA_ID=CAMNT_0002655021 /DNA_START=162 /DNA_END=638 /DNA_ORIENTATION=+